MERDEESKRNGYSAQSCLRVLEEALLTIYEPPVKFMQDNALIHTAKIVKEWLINNGIPIVKWPPYSLDLNPIENL